MGLLRSAAAPYNERMLQMFSHIVTTFTFIIDFTKLFLWWFPAFFQSRHKLAAENIALRSQLVLYQLQQEKKIISKPRCNSNFRLTWVLLMRIFAGWKDVLFIIKPETVIRWHRAGFRVYWRCKSRHKNGRPVVSTEMRRLIRKIHSDNSLWSPERIYNQLINLGFDPPSPNAIRKYLPKPRGNGSNSSQTWKTFISNHMNTTWSIDFFVVPTLTFRLLYVFIIVSHERRELVYFGVTQHPTMLWVIQQLREATAFGIQPTYIIRDNDKIYGSAVTTFLNNTGIKEIRTAFRSPWQNPYVERAIGTLRRELLNHVIPLNKQHLHRLLNEYINKYYHPARTHGSLDHKPPLLDHTKEKQRLPPDVILESKPILGGLYHNYKAKAA